MRLALAALLSMAVLAPGLALAADPPEAEAGLTQVRSHLRTAKVTFRKVKVSAAGDVCGTVAAGADRDLEFHWIKATGMVWINEGETEEQSLFNYGDPLVKRSNERSDYQAWKACQKGG